MKRKEKTLILNSYNIEEKISTNTYYTGQARKEFGLPINLSAQVQSSTDNHDIFGDHLFLITGEISSLLSRYMGTCRCRRHESEENRGYNIYHFDVFLPFYYPEGELSELEKAIENYAIQRMLYLWFMQIKPDEAPVYSREAESILFQLRERCQRRITPQRKKTISKKNIEI